MDLSVTQRLVRTGPDPTMLAPQNHSFFLGTFSSQYSQKLLPQHMQHNLEQIQLEKEQEKRQELQQLMHKSKNEQSAVASPQVRQALRERLMMKQAALERTTPNPSTTTHRGYRELAQDPGMLPKPQMVSLAPPPICDQRKDLALRRTASEPILKRKSALRRHINSRQNPLQRKSSAPPIVKHRQPENMDSSPSGSSTPVSECSSPNDSLLSENGSLTASLAHEAEMLFLTMPPSSTTMPTITVGVPEQANGDPIPGYRLARALPVSGLPQLYLPLDGSSALSQHLQPMLILEPHTGLLHTQFLSSHGLSSVQQQQPYHPCPSPSRMEASCHSHQPLGRTRSEPTPYSQSPLPAHTNLLTQQQLLLNGLLKQNVHLGKLMNKPIMKPRLTHFPSEDLLHSERIRSSCGSVHGSLCEESCHRRCLSGTSTDSVCDTESTSSSRESLVEYTPQHTHSLSQSVYWEHQKQAIRKPAAHLKSLCVPVLLEPSLAHRPLFRTQSSPASTSLPTPLPPPPTEDTMSLTSPGSEMPTKLRFTTGLVYDIQMQKHQCSCGDNSRHPEHPGRIQSIWSRLHERGLRNQCEQIQSRKATVEELESVHSERHVLLYGTNPLNRLRLGLLPQKTFVMLPCGGVGVDNDTIWNEIHTTTASRLAAGCVTDLALRVAQGDLKNGFAVVRPPGHHASHSTPQGFCFFNSVAIAAKQLQQKLNVSKILIVDWDVHHGNGTQEVFYNDPCVMYISLHRYDNGNFFPGSGDPAEVGAGVGEGYNVNVAWTGGLEPPMGDAEYLAAFRTIVMPIAQEFSPDVVLISSGFDAVQGHPAPLGGYSVSAKCFGFLTRQLMSLAGGKVVLALEGGYDLTAICDATEACVSALLGKEMEPLPQAVLEKRPCANAVVSLERVLQIQGAYWAFVRPLASTVALSYQDARSLRLRRDSNSEAIKALASLSMGVLIPHRRLSDDLIEGDGGSM